MRFVVFGAGSIGLRHLRNARALGHAIAGVFDPDPGRLAAAAALAGAGPLVTGDETAALALTADAALVCSPTHRHVEQARAAVARGWHVMVEKPLSHALDGTAALVAETAAARRTVLVGCNLRFLPSLMLVKRLVGEDGVIVWDYIAQTVRVYGKEERRLEVFEESINTDRNAMFVEELRHFVACTETGAPPTLDAAGGRRVLEIALAAKASAAEGR